MCAPRLPSVACTIALSRVNSIASPSRRARSVAMICSRVCWWMTSSPRLISDPPQPESCEDQRASADAGHPQGEVLLEQKKAAERQRRDGQSGDDEARTARDADEDIGGRERERDDRSDLASAHRRQHRKE